MIVADTFTPGTFVDAFRFIGDNHGLLLHKTVEHLELSGAALGIALAIALPLGVWLGHLHRGSFVAINVSNLGRALPSLAVIAIGLRSSGSASGTTRPRSSCSPFRRSSRTRTSASTASTPTSSRRRGGWACARARSSGRAAARAAADLRRHPGRAVFVVATATIAAIAGGGGLGDIIVNQASYRLCGRRRRLALRLGALAFAVAGALGAVTPARFCAAARFVYRGLTA